MNTSTSDRQTSDSLFFRRGVAAFGVNIISALLMFGLHILLARLMGEEFYGTYVYALTWMLVLTLIAKQGFDTALVRFVPMYNLAGDWGKLRGVLGKSFNLCLGLGFILAMLVLAVVTILGERIPSDLKATFLAGAFLIPVLGIVHLLQAALRGFERVPKNELPDRIIRPSLMMGALAFMATKHEAFIEASKIMHIHLAAILIAGVIAAFWLKRALPSEWRTVKPVYETRQWLATAIPLAAFSAMHMLLANIDVLMVGSISGTPAAGVYAVAARIAVFSIFALTAVNAIAAPVITELYEKGDKQALQAMLTKYARINTIFALAVTVGFYLAGDYILHWFGPSFSTGFVALMVLCGGHVINAAAGSVGFLLTMTGHEKQALYILFLTVAANIVLNALMIPLWGITGAAMATALSTVLWNGGMWGYARRKLGLDTAAITVNG